ncbi:signal peptidase I [Enterococcus gilvus]|uniref:signal peptidase I n=1 Tax=Enterococcus gilvus TaxID=160453 RepID=UPI001C8BBFDA|nr:signal peptidase I [Enterococcus gilvus]MBX8939275.1 signal peptidase I [Enterococcus gilvus]
MEIQSKEVDYQVNSETKRKKSTLQWITSGIAIVVSILLIPILIANLVIIVKGSLNPEEIPTVMGYAPMAVVTDSMNTGKSDAIKAGDMVVTKKTNVDKLAVGDIIMFKNNQSAIIHRIVGYNEATNTFTTKGDANNTEDIDPVQKKNIIGKYMLRVPKVGDLILFSRTPLGMLICIGIPILMLLSYDFVAKRLTRREEEKINKKEIE